MKLELYDRSEEVRRDLERAFPASHAIQDQLWAPSHVIAEGLVSEKSRDDKTAIELLVAGIRGWEAGLRRILADEPDSD